MIRVFKVLIMIFVIIIMSACGKEPLLPKNNNDSPTPISEPTPTLSDILAKTSSTPQDTNNLFDIRLFEGEWHSQNQTEIIYDAEGGVLEDSKDSEKCELSIKKLKNDEIKVSVYFTSNTKKTINNNFTVIFSREGKTRIENVNDEIKYIELELGNNGYFVYADFCFNDGHKPINFVKDEMLVTIKKCMEVIREKYGLASNSGQIDGEDIKIEFSSITDDGIKIIVARVEDTVVRASYMFNPNTLEYKLEP